MHAALYADALVLVWGDQQADSRLKRTEMAMLIWRGKPINSSHRTARGIIDVCLTSPSLQSHRAKNTAQLFLVSASFVEGTASSSTFKRKGRRVHLECLTIIPIACRQFGVAWNIQPHTDRVKSLLLTSSVRSCFARCLARIRSSPAGIC